VTETEISKEVGGNGRERMAGFETFALGPKAAGDVHSGGSK
jgi:hypothetical protein